MAKEPRDVHSVSRPIYAFLRDADPDFNRDRTWQTEYEFSNGRRFKGRGDSRGPYANDILPTET